MRKKIVILTLIFVLLLSVIGIGFTIYKNNELKDNKTLVDKEIETSTIDKSEKDNEVEIVEDNSESETKIEIKEEKNNDSVTTKEQTDTPKEEIKNKSEVITKPSNNQNSKNDNPSNNTNQDNNVPQNNNVETPKPVEKKPFKGHKK